MAHIDQVRREELTQVAVQQGVPVGEVELVILGGVPEELPRAVLE